MLLYYLKTEGQRHRETERKKKREKRKEGK
jgi:hypothetical protein